VARRHAGAIRQALEKIGLVHPRYTASLTVNVGKEDIEAVTFWFPPDRSHPIILRGQSELSQKLLIKAWKPFLFEAEIEKAGGERTFTRGVVSLPEVAN